MQLDGILTPKLNMIIKTDITPLNFRVSEIEPSVGPTPIKLSSKKNTGAEIIEPTIQNSRSLPVKARTVLGLPFSYSIASFAILDFGSSRAIAQ